MKRKQMRLLSYCLIAGMIVCVTLGLAACTVSTTATTPETTPNPTSALSSISITPASPGGLALGTTLQLTATGTYADGSTALISSRVTWTSSDPKIATVSMLGLVTSVAIGSTDIAATLSGISSPVINLTVVAPTLSSIAVTPDSMDNLAVGTTQEFAATGTYSDGTTADITSTVTWASSNTNVATISAMGLANGDADGNTNITASLSGVTSPPVKLPVAKLSSIAITQTSPVNLTVGTTQQFTVEGTYDDGSTIYLTSNLIWASSATDIATISDKGIATGLSLGATTITVAVSGAGVTSPAVSLIVVAPVLSSIAITPDSPDTLPVGFTLQFKATGTYSDNSTADITSTVTWASSSSNIVAISTTGLASAIATGSSNITASLSGVTSPAIILPVAVLSSIAATPVSSANITVGSTLTFNALGTYSDGSVALFTSGLIWTSSDPDIATISPEGLATGIALGTTNITVSMPGVGITSPAVPLNVVITTSTTTTTSP